MTQNADVEWLRNRREPLPIISLGRVKRLLAHIDQLEAELNVMIDNATEREMERAYKLDQAERAPSIDEIAVQMMVAMRLASHLSHRQMPTDPETIAAWSYGDAEAIVAERERRRLNG